jgi:adenylate cyclase class 2
MSGVETEIKFRVQDAKKMEVRLRELGFELITPRTFEKNTLFDTEDRRMRAHQEILRVRQYGAKWTVTHKRVPAKNDPDARHKHRIETETTVEDGQAISDIFEQLGLRASFSYEKWRSEWKDSTGHCVIDETPIGMYAELEGPSAWIDAMAEKLAIAPEEMLTLSYGRLFERWQQETGSSAKDLTFAAVEEASLRR